MTTTKTKQSGGDWLGFGNNGNSVGVLAKCIKVGEHECIG